MRIVLSIDGGGIRGIIPAMILKEIEEKSGNPSCYIFDLISGTSTGGIIALGISKPVYYKAEHMVDLYKDQGSRIFHRSWKQKIKSTFGLTSSKYNHRAIESILCQYFNDAPLKSSSTKTVVTGYDIKNRSPIYFSSWGDNKDISMHKAARATSAAPTYFEPTIVGDISVIDGGIFCNNPALLAYTKAKKFWPNEEIFVLSLGTGEQVRSIDHNEAKDWGPAKWAAPAIDCALDGQSDDVHNRLLELCGTKNYLRIQTELTIANDEMDDASPDNVKKLIEEANKLIVSKKEELDYFLSMVIK